jgi:hypothetical protein
VYTPVRSSFASTVKRSGALTRTTAESSVWRGDAGRLFFCISMVKTTSSPVTGAPSCQRTS